MVPVASKNFSKVLCGKFKASLLVIGKRRIITVHSVVHLWVSVSSSEKKRWELDELKFIPGVLP